MLHWLLEWIPCPDSRKLAPSFWIYEWYQKHFAGDEHCSCCSQWLFHCFWGEWNLATSHSFCAFTKMSVSLSKIMPKKRHKHYSSVIKKKNEHGTPYPLALHSAITSCSFTMKGSLWGSWHGRWKKMCWNVSSSSGHRRLCVTHFLLTLAAFSYCSMWVSSSRFHNMMSQPHGRRVHNVAPTEACVAPSRNHWALV